MSTKPTHHAYLVLQAEEGSDRKPQWIRIGAVFQHRNGQGFDVVLPDLLSISGRIVCMPNKPKAPADAEA